MTQPPPPPPAGAPPHGAQHGPYTFDATRGEWIYTAAAPPAYQQPQPPKQRKVWPWVVGAVAVACVMFVGLLAALGSSSEEKPAEPDRKTQAIGLCEQQLGGSSKFPDKATFPGSTITDVAPNKWVVGGTMQAPNMYGEVRVTEFLCSVSYNPDTDRYFSEITEANERE